MAPLHLGMQVMDWRAIKTAYEECMRSVIVIAAYSISRKRKHTFRVRQMRMKRARYGYNETLIPHVRGSDRSYYFDFMRMTPESFDKVLHMVGPHIQKKNTRWRLAIPAAHRLAITLRCLATGETFKSLSVAFGKGRTTIATIVRETSAAIWTLLHPTYLSMPQTSDDWLRIAQDFEDRWNLPHCCGSIDGKHVVMECPGATGSSNFNHNETFSKVLMAVSDSRYRFLVVDLGYYGSESAGGIFSKSVFGSRLINDRLNLPNADLLPNTSLPFPYYFVGDEAFPLRNNLMRPFPRRSTFTHNELVYNYRLSRAQRVVENAFGILAARFQIFRRPLNYSDYTVSSMVMATLVLHNYLIDEGNVYCPPGFADSENANHIVQPGRWRTELLKDGLHEGRQFGSNMAGRDAKELRATLATYLAGPGAVDWQNQLVY